MNTSKALQSGISNTIGPITTLDDTSTTENDIIILMFADPNWFKEQIMTKVGKDLYKVFRREAPQHIAKEVSTYYAKYSEIPCWGDVIGTIKPSDDSELEAIGVINESLLDTGKLANEFRRRAKKTKDGLAEFIQKTLLNSIAVLTSETILVAPKEAIDEMRNILDLAEAITNETIATKPVPLSEYMNNSQPLEFMVFNFLPKHTTAIMHGKTKGGKSQLAISLGLAVATGKDLGCLKVMGSHPVLYCHWEGDRAEVAEKIPPSLTPTPDNFICWYRPDVDFYTGRGMTSFISYIKEQKFEMVIVDPLGRTHSGKENDATEMTKVMSNFDKVAMETGASVFIVHHSKKSTEIGEAVDQARGSSAIVNCPRVAIFYKAGQNNTSKIEIRGNSIPTYELHVALVNKETIVSPMEESIDIKDSIALERDKIVECVNRLFLLNPNGVSVKQVKLDLKTSRTEQWLRPVLDDLAFGHNRIRCIQIHKNKKVYAPIDSDITAEKIQANEEQMEIKNLEDAKEKHRRKMAAAMDYAKRSAERRDNF